VANIFKKVGGAIAQAAHFIEEKSDDLRDFVEGGADDVRRAVVGEKAFEKFEENKGTVKGALISAAQGLGVSVPIGLAVGLPIAAIASRPVANTVRPFGDALSAAEVIAATQTPRAPAISPVQGSLIPNQGGMNLGDIVTNIGSVIKQPSISNVLGLTTSLTGSAIPGQSAAGIAAAAVVQGANVAVQQQTTGSGIFSGLVGFIGGGSKLQSKASVIPSVASNISSQGGGNTIPLGGGVSLQLPENNPSPQTQPTTKGVYSIPLWILIAVVAVVIGVIVAVVKSLKK